MTEIHRRLDAIIRELKCTGALSRMRFVREYASEYAEMPVRHLLAAVCVTRTVRERGYFGGLLSPSVRGESYSVTAEIRVYAPSGGNGTGLSEVVSELLAALEKADEEKLILSAAASSIEFDADLNAIFRRVTLEMSFCVSGEAEYDRI